MMIFKGVTYLQIVLALTNIYKEWIPSLIGWLFTHKWMPKPWHCMVCHILLNWIQPYIVTWILMKTNSTNDSNLVDQAEKVQSDLLNNENITYSFIAHLMQSSILFCCTETNNILRAVSSSEDAVLSMRTFTWFWCLPVSGVCRSA